MSHSLSDHTIEKSIAVLPCVNMSADPENEYFSDGISEEIINALTKVQGLKVTARTSAFASKGKNVDVRLIAKQLNVVSILEGSVRSSLSAAGQDLAAPAASSPGFTTTFGIGGEVQFRKISYSKKSFDNDGNFTNLERDVVGDMVSYMLTLTYRR